MKGPHQRDNHVSIEIRKHGGYDSNEVVEVV